MAAAPEADSPGASDPARLRAIVADRAFDGSRALGAGVQILIRGSTIVGVESGVESSGESRGESSGESHPVALPADCEVLRFPGATVLPGLIDSHVHLCAGGEPDALARDPDRSAAERESVIRTSLRQHLAAGVTAVRDLGDHRWAVVRRSAAADEPLVTASGPPITTPGGHCSAMGGAAQGAHALKAAVRQRFEQGAQVVKLIVSGGAMTAGSDLLQLQYSPAQVRLVVAQAHRFGLPVTAHAHSVPAVRACLAAGVDGIEHCTCLTARGIDTPPALIRALAASRVEISPTFGRLPGSAPSAQALEVIRRTGMSMAARFAQVGDLHRAGATILAGSDAGIHPAKPHGVLPYAVAELVGSGLPPETALAAATSLSARACGLQAQIGRLRPGLRADLLVVDGDPTRTISDLTRVRSVFLAGRQVSTNGES